MQQAGQGDVHAQSLLYGQFSKAMFNICLRMTADRHDAEDLLQESFVLAFKNINQLKLEKNFGGWLKRIVVNECIRYGKKKIRWSELDEGTLDLPLESDEGWMHEVSMERIALEISRLPDACRMVFTLYAIEDYTHREIAEAMQVTESTSKSQYHRAKQLLRSGILKTAING